MLSQSQLKSKFELALRVITGNRNQQFDAIVCMMFGEARRLLKVLNPLHTDVKEKMEDSW